MDDEYKSFLTVVAGVVLLLGCLGLNCQFQTTKWETARHAAQAACVQAGNPPHECERLK